MRDEHLRSVQHPAVAILDRGRSHRGRIAARAGLGQPPRRELRRPWRAAPGTSASVPRCRTSRCAPRPDRCAPQPTTTRSDRRGPALRCRCSSRPRSSLSRRMPRETGCPSDRDRQASAASSFGKCCASSHSMTWGTHFGFGEFTNASSKKSLFLGEREIHYSDYICRGQTHGMRPGNQPVPGGRIQTGGGISPASRDRAPAMITAPAASVVNDDAKVPAVVRQHVVVDAQIQASGRCACGPDRSRSPMKNMSLPILPINAAALRFPIGRFGLDGEFLSPAGPSWRSRPQRTRPWASK